jgi:cytoskeleton protein RodZ
MTSFGEYLRRERETRGVSLREIATATRIGVCFLQALEDDRLDRLPGGIFPRAFLRQYAAHLALDVEKVLDEFTRAHADGLAQKPVERAAPETAWFLRQPWCGRLGTAAGVVVIAGALFVGGRQSSTPKRASLDVPVVQTVPARVYPTPTPEAQPPAGLKLTLTAQQDCWVEIQVDGRSVLNRVLAVGETTTLEATDEFRLSVGNAGGLALSVNDRPGIPLGRSGEVKRGILINRESLSSFVVHGGTGGSSESG